MVLVDEGNWELTGFQRPAILKALAFRGPWSGSCSFHRNDLPKWRTSSLGRCPDDWIRRGFTRKPAAKVGEKYHGLWYHALLLEPVEARPKIRSASSNRREGDGLSCLIRLHLLNRGVEVEHVHQPGPLSGKDRPNLRFEQP